MKRIRKRFLLDIKKMEGDIKMVYEMLKKEVIAENETYCKDMLKAIEKRESVLQRESTPTRWEQFQKKWITRRELVEYTNKRIMRKYEKKLQADLETIALCEKAEMPETISILVEWKKSSVWGNNPHATVKIGSATFEGSASGCGYDKLSAAIANAFNKSYRIQKILFEMKEKALQEGETGNNHSIIGYGSGYNALPNFEYGVGINCFISILQKANYKCERNCTDDTDSYFFYK